MDDHYDVFGDLNEMCNNNVLAKFKTLPVELPANIDDPDVDAMLNEMENSPRSDASKKSKRGAKTTTPSPTKSQPKRTSQGSLRTPPPAKRASPLSSPAKAPENQCVGRRTRSSLSRRQASALAALDAVTNPQSNPKPKGRRGRGSKRQSTTRAVTPPTQAVTLPTPELPATTTAENVQNVETIDITQGVPDMPPPPTTSRRAGRGTPFDVMRARRNYIAEIAARSTNVDYVDLISSPMLHIEGVISVDSDEEKEQAEKIPQNALSPLPNDDLFECSFDEDNPEISVKIRWMGANPEIFKLRKYQKFGHIFKQLAEREKNQVDTLVFNIKNKIITSDDTPASIDYKIYQFIDGRVLAGNFVGPVKKRDANKITLKVQSDQWKRPLMVEIAKKDKFKILYIKCAEELSIPHERIRLSFDGEHLEYNATPADFELEGGEAIDLRIKK